MKGWLVVEVTNEGPFRISLLFEADSPKLKAKSENTLLSAYPNNWFYTG